VATDILGVSGRAMLEALIGGTTDPNVLADLARGRLRAKLSALRQALAGRFRPHHAFLVTQLLAHLDHLDELIATVSGQVDEVIAPFAEDLARLDALPGVNRRIAEVILADTAPRGCRRSDSNPRAAACKRGARRRAGRPRGRHSSMGV